MSCVRPTRRSVSVFIILDDFIFMGVGKTAKSDYCLLHSCPSVRLSHGEKNRLPLEGFS